MNMGNLGIGNSTPIMFLSRCGAVDGLQRQLLYLAGGMARASYPVTTVVFEAGEMRDQLVGMGIETLVQPMRQWRSFPSCLFRYKDALRLTGIARERDIQLVHAHDAWRAEYARFVAGRLGIPYIVHMRGPLSRREILKHKLHLADGIIAISRQYVKDLLAAGIPARRIEMIEDAVDLSSFRPGLNGAVFRRKFQLPEGILVGLVGRVSPCKRVLDFLEMIAILPASLANTATFLVIGDTEDDEYNSKVKLAVERLGLQRRVRFTGRCNSGCMPEAMAALDLLVTFSGGSIMFEAMACEKPVLSVRQEGRLCHTLNGEIAIWVTTDKPGPAAESLRRLLCDTELRRRLGHAARTHVERRHSVKLMVDKTEAFYLRLLSDERAARRERDRSIWAALNAKGELLSHRIFDI